ncbi:M48 family metallopeptidase [candidate division KSB1 bacterium]|nr:M48 family metallopeptidase [candidate division KSB1 bacterium]
MTMKNDFIRIDLESKLSQELFELFEAPIVDRIMREGKVENERNPYLSALEGHSFKITPKMAPGLFTLCHEVQNQLEFKEEIDYFITNSAETNCFAVWRLEDDQHHIIMINSALIERLDDDELRFVIGHEIGHLINENIQLYKIIDFVFPEMSRVPLVFQNKISLWKKLSELTADRYGYIASPKLDKCISNFFKLASGLDTQRIAFDPLAYLSEMEQALSYFEKEPFAVTTSHPINPVRIKALQLFHQSNLYQQIARKDTLTQDEKLMQQINDLIKILMIVGQSELDQFRSHFVASGGLIVSGIDQQLTEMELNEIIDLLAQFTIFPKEFLDQIVQSGKVHEIFENSIVGILRQNPSERYGMFEFLVGIALSDNEIIQGEIDILYEIGEKLFQFTRKEIAQIIGGVIQKRFVPRLFVAQSPPEV